MAIKAAFHAPQAAVWAVEARTLFQAASEEAARERREHRARLGAHLRRLRTRSRARAAAAHQARETRLLEHLAAEVGRRRVGLIRDAREALIEIAATAASEVLRREFSLSSRALQTRLDEALRTLSGTAVQEVRTHEHDPAIAPGDAVIMTAAGSITLDWRTHLEAALEKVREAFDYGSYADEPG